MLAVNKNPNIICYLVAIGFGTSFVTLPLTYPNNAQSNEENHTIKLGYLNSDV